MRTFTAIVPTQPVLPAELGLLLAPVRSEEPSASEAHVARADGVLLDEGGHVVAFILRLAKTLDPRGGRTMVPVAALHLSEGPKLHLVWTQDQLLAQPRLDEDLQADSKVDVSPPVSPPGPGANKAAAVTEGIEGGLLGAAFGALAGLAIGGPIAVASMAVFFATGGSLAGLIGGAAEEAKPGVTETHFDPISTGDHLALGAALSTLEVALQDPRLVSQGVVSSTRLMPMTPAAPFEAPPDRAREVVGWR